MRRINLIADAGSGGLARDLAVLAEALGGLGFEVAVTPMAHKKGTLGDALRLRARALEGALRGRRPWRHDINIMLERIYPGLFGLARRNLLIPNPEWQPMKLARHLGRFDGLLVKTRHAEEIYRALGLPTRFVGFASQDRLDPARLSAGGLPQAPRETEFLHVAGKSPLKGTLPLVDLWSRHPRWPRLTVVFRAPEADRLPQAGNVTLIRTLLSDAELLRLQNVKAFHLCPSETEGYGHYLAEALSVAAVVVTLDAPPMNELVAPERGLLVPARATGRQCLATLHGFDAEDMAAAVERCLALSAEERAQLGGKARAWFLDNQRAFPGRLAAALAA